jgi:hypothetical protein
VGVAPVTEATVVGAPAAETAQVKTVPRWQKLPFRWQPRPAYAPIYGGALKSTLLVATVLMVGSWILYRDRPSGMFSTPPSEVPKPSSNETAPPFTPAQQVSPSNTVNNNATTDVARSNVRYLPPHSSKRKSPTEGRVQYFGDDVTVRYFTPKPEPVKTTLREGDIHHISDDVTVRYFSPRNVERGQPEATTDKPVNR